MARAEGGEVLVRWARPLGLDPAVRRDLAGLLDAAERDRLAALRHQADRDRFAVGHVLLRVLVEELTGVEASSVRITARCDVCAGPHGRPRAVLAGAARVARPDPRVHLSMSHSGDRVLAAATRAGRVGVDVEPVAAQAFADWPGFDAEAFPVAVRRAVYELPVERRPAARAAAWVRQEAAFKAGLGRAGAGHPLAPEPGVQGQDLDCGPGYVAALVVRSPVPVPSLLEEWRPGSRNGTRGLLR